MAGRQTGDKKARVLDYLRRRSADGLPPTVREICAATGIKSTSTVHTILRALEEQGLIVRDAHASRAIQVEGMAPAARVPLVGVVTAGVPILAEENIEEYLPFPGGAARGRTLFALRVKGLSMKNAGILDGDVVYAERADDAENGEIVIALVGREEATVKRFFRENGRVRLEPENPDFSPIVSDEIRVLGRVIASFREY